MRIAICDNESIAIEALLQKIKNVSKTSHIQSFTSIQQFWNVIEDGGTFHIVFMDIDWEETYDGMDFAARLYELQPNAQVIYVTGYNDRFSQQIFLRPVNLCGYLLKPVDEVLLRSLLQKAENTFAHQSKEKLLVRQKGIIHAVGFHEIVYLESMGHQVLIHTHDRLLSCYERLELLKRRLPGRFLQCHKSYLVNMDYIQHIEKSGILMNNGERIPVSKAQYANTRSAYFRFMGQML